MTGPIISKTEVNFIQTPLYSIPIIIFIFTYIMLDSYHKSKVFNLSAFRKLPLL
ncbi:hypothetical protein LFU01_08050 [Lysinibacillus fusiformis]|nr:hypothetical protein LFU01_08050 [Lysinibacillus fusiformis]